MMYSICVYMWVVSVSVCVAVNSFDLHVEDTVLFKHVKIYDLSRCLGGGASGFLVG